ncbi:hypothetical protein [Lentzea sp. NPDC004782]|uniref:hypothetical protein n=1 Tax=Lentzea sp. NPDC004782 TaxID=3154458 RepID=UPI00339FA7F0
MAERDEPPVDDGLLFEDAPGRPWPTVVVNQQLRELPTSGRRRPGTGVQWRLGSVVVPVAHQ